MATITIDYEEFESLKKAAKMNEEELIKKTNKAFDEWRKQYQRQMNQNEKCNLQVVINRINALLIHCNLNENILGYVKAEKIKEDLREMKEFVEGL